MTLALMVNYLHATFSLTKLSDDRPLSDSLRDLLSEFSCLIDMRIISYVISQGYILDIFIHVLIPGYRSLDIMD